MSRRTTVKSIFRERGIGGKLCRDNCEDGFQTDGGWRRLSGGKCYFAGYPIKACVLARCTIEGGNTSVKAASLSPNLG